MKMNDSTLAGVQMGEGFKDELYAPLELKEFVSNESRLEDGRRVITTNTSGTSLAKKASRSISLEFCIVGSNESDFNTKKNALFTELYKGSVKLEVPEIGSDVFHLIYLGKSNTYSSGLSKCSCKVKVSFEEPDPSRRTSA